MKHYLQRLVRTLYPTAESVNRMYDELKANLKTSVGRKGLTLLTLTPLMIGFYNQSKVNAQQESPTQLDLFISQYDSDNDRSVTLKEYLEREVPKVMKEINPNHGKEYGHPFSNERLLELLMQSNIQTKLGEKFSYFDLDGDGSISTKDDKNCDGSINDLDRLLLKQEPHHSPR